jgi:hypothetical protein
MEALAGLLSFWRKTMDVRNASTDELLEELKHRLEVYDRMRAYLEEQGSDVLKREEPPKKTKAVAITSTTTKRGRPKSSATKLTRADVLKVLRQQRKPIPMSLLLPLLREQMKNNGINSAMVSGHLRRLLETGFARIHGDKRPFFYSTY